KKVSFVGMWAARKGAHDWMQIITHVRREIPDARFCFYGTMVDSPVIAHELGAAGRNGVEFISEYVPSELPKLLSDCAVAAFPRYVEGFGLAVLEQLAAGIPTVAFDIPGPADVLGARASELLVQPGDVEGLSRILCRSLKLDSDTYRQLSQKCVEIAA